MGSETGMGSKEYKEKICTKNAEEIWKKRSEVGEEKEARTQVERDGHSTKHTLQSHHISAIPRDAEEETCRVRSSKAVAPWRGDRIGAMRRRADERVVVVAGRRNKKKQVRRNIPRVPD